MRELDIIRRKIADLFDAGDSAGLDRIYEVLNSTVAELAIMRALLNPPSNEHPTIELQEEGATDES